MSCKKFETDIYLYRELSPREKTSIDRHLSTCPQCTALFETLQQSQSFILRVAGQTPAPINHAHLTSSIMGKITPREKPSFFELAYGLLLSHSSRITLSMVSSVLLIAFCAMAFGDISNLREKETTPLAHAVILNAKLFRENFSHKKEKHALFADCRAPFQSNQSYLNCLKTKLK